MRAQRTRLPRTRTSTACALILIGALQSACINVTTQRWPGPMSEEVSPLPPGDSNLHPPGPEEVTVVRHADPVRIRPSGANSGRPLTFYDKQARLTAGAQVVVAPGGRAEILWPSGSSVILFGRSVGWIGSPSRGESMFDLREVERARVLLSEEDQVRLVGGSVLSGAGGPYLLTLDADGTLAVHNQSKGGMTVAFRDAVFEMGPGQRVVLPLLSDGGVPYELPEGSERLAGPGFNLDVLGDIDPVGRSDGVLVRATGASEISALGVRVRLAPGGTADFSNLGQQAEEAPSAPAPSAEPAETAPEAVPEGEDSGGG